MINENTNVLEAPYSLATLSQATGNPMLDLGYQCCDMRPYFKYSNGNKVYYITVYPSNIVSQVLNVYEKTTKNIDGEDYDAMSYVGTTTSANTQTITFDNVEYTYQNQYENIRGFYTNKWAKYKPINSGGETELVISEDDSKDDFVKANCGLELTLTEVPTAGATNYDSLIETMLDDLNNGRFKWIYRPPSIKNNDWFRMTDFLGYNNKTVNPFYMEYPGGIGPTVGGIRDIYIDTKEDTADVKVLIGEYKKNELPANNVTTSCLPDYFKKEHALGLIYSGGNGFEFIDPVDDKGTFKYPLLSGESVEIPFNVKIGSTYNIGAYLINKDYGDSGYYLPVKPLNLKFKRIPDVIRVDYDYYVDGPKDLVIRVTITRNGSVWWWGVHRPDDYVYGVRTVTNYPSYTDHPLICWAKKDSEAQYNNIGNDNREERELVKGGVTYEWNGCSEPNTQSGIDNPIFEVPHLYGVDSLTVYFRFVELKDAIYPTKNSIGDVYIQGNLLINIQGSNYRTQEIKLGREIFEDPKVGWL